MKLKLYVGKVNPDFEVKGYQEDEQTPVAGDPVYLVELEPVLLTKQEYEELLKKTKNHEIEVTA